jgi:hypothetical protein
MIPNTLFKASSILLSIFLSSGCTPKVASLPSPNVESQAVTFASPALAVEALTQAVAKADVATLERLFGPESKELLHSGDDVADQRALEDFAEEIADGKHTVELTSDSSTQQETGVARLLVGDDQWPFPIPIKKVDGRWQFDTASGKEEILLRRIGENELGVISLAKEYVSAQIEYSLQDRNGDGIREFATKFISTPGNRDGLYWEPVDGEPLSPIGPLIAAAALEGYSTSVGDAPQAFHGYRFRILTRQDKNGRGGAVNYVRSGRMTEGFALLAYPAEWSSSGVMTFLVGPDGVTYQKNLGPETAEIASKMSAFSPDFSWDPT